MVKTDTIEGIVIETTRFRCDRFADVLYLRLRTAEETQTSGDLTDGGDILLRDGSNEQPVGLTIVS